MIQYMKALGMNLVQIKQCLGGQDIREFRSILERQKQNIEKQILEMHYAKQAIERSIESYRRYEAAPEENTVILEYRPKRRIFCYDTNINCYSYGMDYYEHILRSLKKNYVLHHLPMCYFCNVGSVLRKAYFQSDSSSPGVWWLLCGVSAAGIVTLIVLGKWKKAYKR
jgi:DNA-binding transcriptional MerR regulator